LEARLARKACEAAVVAAALAETVEPLGYQDD